jgi:glycosyltransferase involved in cell wall biosynthesis
MGIDVMELSNGSGERFRRKFGLDGKHVVLFAGIKGYDKGAVHVLRAVEELNKKINNVVLVAVGFATREWIDEVERLGHTSFLLDLPYVSGREKADVFDACDVLVMPSRSDAFGIVYLEAWYMGKPVIGARSGGVQAVINDGIDGFLVNFGDVGNIVRKIQLLLNHPVLAEKLGNRGKAKVIANYTWPKIVDKIEMIYEKITVFGRIGIDT